jgi:serine/threonine-protein kinase
VSVELGQGLGARFVIEQRLGIGGMGTVYRASHRGGGPDRAVKVLRAELVEDPVILGRFVQERTLMIKLRGPHLVNVEDMIIDGQLFAIVMELVNGGTLRAYSEAHGPFAAPVALGFVRQILLGLDAVHSAGVVHRDLKPENVLLHTGPDGETVLKVSDFGIARLVDSPRVTATANFIGTPHYCPPEVGTGEAAVAAGDVFSMGVLLYELLSGTVPYPGLPLLAVLKRQLEELPPRSPLIGDPVWPTLLRWMNADPAARPPNARQALLEVDDLLKALSYGGARTNAVPFAVPPQAPPVGSMPGQVRLDVAALVADAGGTTAAKPQPPPRPPAGGAGGPRPDYPQVVHQAPARDTAKPAPQMRPYVPWDLPPIAGQGGAGTAGQAVPASRPTIRRTKKVAAIGAAGVVLVGGAAAAVVLATTGGKSPTRTSAVGNSTTIPTFTVKFATEAFPQQGMTVDRTWTLQGGKTPALHGVLSFRPSKTGVVQMDEILPKTLVTDASLVKFSPQPKVISADPVVRYTVQGIAGQVITDTYDVPVAPSDVTMTNLQNWAAQMLAQSGETYRTGTNQVTAISLSPTPVSIETGQTLQLQPGGKLANGQQAPTVALGGAVFSVDNKKIATVSSTGLVTGISTGITTVHMKLGTHAVAVPVVVAPAPSQAAGIQTEAPNPGQDPNVQSPTASPTHHFDGTVVITPPGAPIPAAPTPNASLFSGLPATPPPPLITASPGPTANATQIPTDTPTPTPPVVPVSPSP